MKDTRSLALYSIIAFLAIVVFWNVFIREPEKVTEIKWKTREVEVEVADDAFVQKACDLHEDYTTLLIGIKMLCALDASCPQDISAKVSTLSGRWDLFESTYCQ